MSKVSGTREAAFQIQYPPIVIAHPVESDIRLIQIAPGHDPADEPLLSHAGLVCEMGSRIEVAMGGMSGVSDKIRQFLTTINNDLTEEVLTLLAEELNDPVRRASKVPMHHRRAAELSQQRAAQIRTDLDLTPIIPEDLMPSPVSSVHHDEDGPEP